MERGAGREKLPGQADPLRGAVRARGRSRLSARGLVLGRRRDPAARAMALHAAGVRYRVGRGCVILCEYLIRSELSVEADSIRRSICARGRSRLSARGLVLGRRRDPAARAMALHTAGVRYRVGRGCVILCEYLIRSELSVESDSI